MKKSKKQQDYLYSKKHLENLRKIGFQKGHKICVGRKISDETKNKIRNSKFHRNLNGENNPNFGKKHPLHSKRMKKDNPSKREDIKKKLSLLKKGKYKLENNPNWKGGTSFEPYSTNFNNELKERIKKKYKYICQLCKEKIIQNIKQKFLCVHHIDYNKKNTKDTNLITLCNFCNSSVNKSRKEWTSFFRNQIENETH